MSIPMWWVVLLLFYWWGNQGSQRSSTCLISRTENVRKQDLGFSKQNIKLNTSYTMSTFYGNFTCVRTFPSLSFQSHDNKAEFYSLVPLWSDGLCVQFWLMSCKKHHGMWLRWTIVYNGKIWTLFLLQHGKQHLSKVVAT